MRYVIASLSLIASCAVSLAQDAVRKVSYDPATGDVLSLAGHMSVSASVATTTLPAASVVDDPDVDRLIFAGGVVRYRTPLELAFRRKIAAAIRLAQLRSMRDSLVLELNSAVSSEPLNVQWHAILAAARDRANDRLAAAREETKP